MSDRNAKTIEEFRANEGRVGGTFEGSPLVLVHHRGRKSGQPYVTPVMYLPDEADPNIIYVFATRGGTPVNPDWYYNLIAEGEGTVERGTETYHVTVRDMTGDERDRITQSRPAATLVSPSMSARRRVSGPSPCSNFGERSAVVESIRPDLGYASYVDPR